MKALEIRTLKRKTIVSTFNPCPWGVGGLVGQQYNAQCTLCCSGAKEGRYANGCIKEAETALLAAGWRGKWYNEDKYKVAGGGGGASGPPPAYL